MVFIPMRQADVDYSLKVLLKEFTEPLMNKPSAVGRAFNLMVICITL